MERIVDPPVASALLAEHTARRQRGGRLGAAVVLQLVDDIVTGVYPPGSTLPIEADLGGNFGVSRTVVRESATLLQDRGLVRILQGKGTVVMPPESWDLIDDVVLSAVVRHDETLSILDEVVAVRAALECEMAASAAERMTTARAELLRQAFRDMEHSANDVAEFGAADVRFHDLVMEFSGSRLARAIVASIHGKARSTGRYHGSISAAKVAETLEEHQDILGAICRGDAEAANNATRAHIIGSWTRRRPPVRPGS